MTIISPVSTAVSAMNADRHQHQHQQHQEDSRRQRAQAVAPPVQVEPEPVPVETSAPITETHIVPEGAFAASQLAERLQLLEANLRAISTGERPWSPPRSDLNLRDRTV